VLTLRESTLEYISEMICGNPDGKFSKHFPYRSSSSLTRFFRDCDLENTHDGSSRKWWVLAAVKELAQGPASSPDLPSDTLLVVLSQLMSPEYFDKPDSNRDAALQDLNTVLERESLVAYEDNAKNCHIRNTGTGAVSALQALRPRPLSSIELEQRQRIVAYLDKASEDDFTEKVLVPFFQRQGFHRVIAAGHKEKLLEFGKDLWMKFQLPTGHWIYFCAQIKRVKIDSKGVSKGNVAEVLNQARMALKHPIFDPDFNKKVLLDHLFLISAGEITRQAREWLIHELDTESRRHIIFMDRDDFLNHSARIIHDIPLGSAASDPNDIPF
jgi:hypothetical protein